jgi:hypothetical protein
MTSSRVWLWTILGTCLALAPTTTRSAEPAQEQRPVCFEITLVEVPVAALKKAGIDLAELTKVPPAKEGSPQRPGLPGGGRASQAYVDSDTFPTVVQSLMKEKVGRILAHSRIDTVSGHKLSLQLGDAIELQATPEAIDAKHLKLEYYLKFSEPLAHTETEKRHGLPAGKRQIFSSMGIKVVAGRTTAESGGPVRRTDARGETEEVAIVTLVQADFKESTNLREAAIEAPKHR